MKESVKHLLIIVILVFIIIGFTLPGILYNSEEKAIEKRFCSNDIDCGLLCEKPRAVPCLNNFCLINSCSEQNPFGEIYSQNKTFVFKITLKGETINLSSPPNKIFVKTNGQKITLYSDLPLSYLFQAFGLNYYQECLSLGNQTFCDLVSSVNNQTQPLDLNYVPLENDLIEIIG